MGTPTPAGNQFNTNGYYNLYADGVVSEVIKYNNNANLTIYDPKSYVTSQFNDNPCASTLPSGDPCPLNYDYTPPDARTAHSDLVTLDGTISETTDAETLADLWAQHDDITGFLGRYYAMGAKYDSAAALFASYNKYRDALPFYIAAGDYVNASTMWSNLPMNTDEDKQYAWLTGIEVSLYSAGHTWLDVDTVTLDSMTRMVQYNDATGGIAGGITALLGVAPVTYPVPATDSALADTLSTMAGGMGARTAASGQNTAQPDNNKTKAATLQFSVFPNPTYGTLSITSSTSGTFTLYTMLGQEVQHYAIAAGKSDILLPASLAIGMYIGKFNPTDGSDEKEIRLVYQP